jgi:SNF2 family DNA or RNA helicase
MTIYDEVLYPYQQVAASRIKDSRRILLADQPGLGKTLEVLAGLELAGLFDKPSAILIITPIINAQTTWRDTVERFIQPRYPDVTLIDVSKGTASQKSKQFKKVYPDGPVIVLANHNAIDMTTKGVRVPEVATVLFDAVVIDESHMVLPIKDPRKLTNFWKGLIKLQIPKHAFRIAVSGTPDRGKLDNRYGTWFFLHPELTPGKWQWLEENFWMSEQQVSRTRTVKVPTSLKSEQAWMERDRQWMIRRTKQEVLPQLPPKRYIDVEIELGTEQFAAYALRQLESQRKIYDAKVEERDSGEAMVFALRARQLSTCSWQEVDNGVVPVVGGDSAKLDWLLEWFAERGFTERDDMADNSAKVVIVSSFSKVLHWLKEELSAYGIDCAVLDGNVSDNRRASIQRDFQQGALRVVLLSGSMGVGINLDAADDLIMLDSPYDPDRIEQIEDRVHRASNMHHVTIWNLIAQNTIDQAILEQVSKRYKVTRELMDGSRGVEFGRDILSRLNKGEK